MFGNNTQDTARPLGQDRTRGVPGRAQADIVKPMRRKQVRA